MKRLILILLLSVTAFVHAATNEKSITMAGSLWTPFIDQNHPELGVATDLVASIFKRAGYETTPILEPWSRTLEGAAIGVYDMIISAWQTPQREKYFAFSDPYLFNEIKFIRRKGNPFSYTGLNSLAGKTVGIVDGFAYGDEFNNSQVFNRVTRSDVLQNLKLLNQGGIDLTLGDQWVLRYQLANYIPNAIKSTQIIDTPLSRRGLHVAISRANPNHEQIRLDFNSALKAMKVDGSYDKIIEKHKKNLGYLIEQAIKSGESGTSKQDTPSIATTPASTDSGDNCQKMAQQLRDTKGKILRNSALYERYRLECLSDLKDSDKASLFSSEGNPFGNH